MRTHYGPDVDLLYTDTDSLLLEIKTENVYKDMQKNIEEYDTSDFPEDHFLHNTKDECAGRPIAEYVGLRPKMYSILEASGKNIKKAKGVKKTVVKNQLRHKQYKEVLTENKVFHHGMNVLRSVKHQTYGQHLNKVSLSPYDAKRWITKNGIDTFAYGHKTLSGGN